MMTPTTQQALNALAAQMDKVAHDETNWGLMTWGVHGEYGYNRRMCKVVRADSRDLRRVGRLISQGKIAEACDFAGNLDTVVRELIPDNIWDFLQGFATAVNKATQAVNKATQAVNKATQAVNKATQAVNKATQEAQ